MGKKKQESSSSSSDESSSSSSEVAPVKKVTTKGKVTPAPTKAKTPVKADSSDSSSDSSSSSSEAPVKSKKVATPKETQKAKAKPKAKKEESSSSESDSDSDDSSSSSSEEKKKKPTKAAAPAKATKKKQESSDSDSSDSSDESSSEEAPKKAAPKGNDKKRKADDAADEPAAKKVKTDDEANTRVFLGNLPYSIDDDKIKEFFKDAGELVDIHWVTDRNTGKFYGTGFVQFATAEQAAAAVALNGTDLLGRPAKIDFAQAKGTKGATPQKEGGFQRGGDRRASFGADRNARAPTPKPDGCTTVFLGNLSFSIDEDGVRKHFGGCGEISAIRWVERDGQFKGCGFVEFANSSSTDKAVALNGSDLMGRPVRVDYSAPKPPRQ